MHLCLKVARAKSDLLNILYNTRISWKTQFRIVDKTGVDEKGVDKTGVDEKGVDKTGVDEKGVDKTGVDEKGVDETSSRRKRSRRARYQSPGRLLQPCYIVQCNQVFEGGSI